MAVMMMAARRGAVGCGVHERSYKVKKFTLSVNPDVVAVAAK
jgi:hypothetical protein